MSHKLGPETDAGAVLKEEDYFSLWSKLAEQKRGVLAELCVKVGAAVDAQKRQGATGYASDVCFVRSGGVIKRVQGRTVTEVYAKALALGIDRQLARIVEARQLLDAVTDAIECDRTMMQLERLILAATVPTTHLPAVKKGA